MEHKIDIAKANQELAGKSAQEILAWCYAAFTPRRIKLSTSFGAEGMVLMHMLVNQVKDPRIFTIDTGRNFQQTYDVWHEAVSRYGVDIEAFFPEPEDINELMRNGGPNMFYASVEQRKHCCYVRKVKPLRRALADADVWITGLRREQASSRGAIEHLSYTPEHDVYKVCPIADWTEVNVWEYIRNNDVPYNKLYDEGYPTIGCAPCCRSVGRAQDIRAGRWWWEQDGQKECGIHIDGDRVVRKRGPMSYNI